MKRLIIIFGTLAATAVISLLLLPLAISRHADTETTGSEIAETDAIPQRSREDLTQNPAVDLSGSSEHATRTSNIPLTGEDLSFAVTDRLAVPHASAQQNSGVVASKPDASGDAAAIPVQGSQTESLPTSANALPPEHLAALIASADEAEIIQENDANQGDARDASTKDKIDVLQQRVSLASDSDRQQISSDLFSEFRSCGSDESKINLLAMAAELGPSAYSASLLSMGLASTENEDVRIQAVYVASDLSPEFLKSFANDPNEAVRNEVKSLLLLP